MRLNIEVDDRLAHILKSIPRGYASKLINKLLLDCLTYEDGELMTSDEMYEVIIRNLIKKPVNNQVKVSVGSKIVVPKIKSINVSDFEFKVDKVRSPVVKISKNTLDVAPPKIEHSVPDLDVSDNKSVSIDNTLEGLRKLSDMF